MHCRPVLYQLSQQGSPGTSETPLSSLGLEPFENSTLHVGGGGEGRGRRPGASSPPFPVLPLCDQPQRGLLKGPNRVSSSRD